MVQTVQPLFERNIGQQGERARRTKPVCIQKHLADKNTPTPLELLAVGP